MNVADLADGVAKKVTIGLNRRSSRDYIYWTQNLKQVVQPTQIKLSIIPVKK